MSISKQTCTSMVLQANPALSEKEAASLVDDMIRDRDLLAAHDTLTRGNKALTSLSAEKVLGVHGEAVEEAVSRDEEGLMGGQVRREREARESLDAVEAQTLAREMERREMAGTGLSEFNPDTGE